MDHLPFGFDLSLCQSAGPYVLGIPLYPLIMLVRSIAVLVVLLALGMLFVRCGENSAHWWGASGPPEQHAALADALLAGTLASLVAGIVVVAGTFTGVQALVR
jgi:hypothetical protein